jgi:hypothetical protein
VQRAGLFEKAQHVRAQGERILAEMAQRTFGASDKA